MDDEICSMCGSLSGRSLGEYEVWDDWTQSVRTSFCSHGRYTPSKSKPGAALEAAVKALEEYDKKKENLSQRRKPFRRRTTGSMSPSGLTKGVFKILARRFLIN